MHQPKKKKAHIEFQLKCSYTPMCTMTFVDVMAKNSFVMNAKQSESEREGNNILRYF